MAKTGGYTGRILHVDLSTRESRVEPLAPHLRQEFLGGGCTNARLAHDLIPKGAAPLSPDNALIFGSGPFVGTLIPGSGKSNVTYKSPLTGLLGSSGGVHLGLLKFAGYDHLVVKGKADRPVVLLIRDDQVEVLTLPLSGERTPTRRPTPYGTSRGPTSWSWPSAPPARTCSRTRTSSWTSVRHTPEEASAR